MTPPPGGGAGPLTGKRVLVTRTREQASELAAKLEQLGATVIAVPLIEIAPPASLSEMDRAIARLLATGPGWLLFTSANAVKSLISRSPGFSLGEGWRVAAIGPASARAVEAAGLRVSLMPKEYVAEALAEALESEARLGSTMMLLRAEQGRDVLVERLSEAGAAIEVVAAYRNVVPPGSAEALRKALEEGLDAITFTSSSTVTHLVSLAEMAGVRLAESTMLASIGPVTSRTLRDEGLTVAVEAREATVESLVQAVLERVGLGLR